MLGAIRRRRFPVGVPVALGFALAIIPGVGRAQESAAPAPPAAALDPDSAKELAGTTGPYLDQLEAKRRLPRKAFVPPAKSLAPFAAAELGAPIAHQLAYGVDYADAPRVQAFCQAIVDRLIAAWPGPKEPVRVQIVAEGYYHGEATPVGVMQVSLGTFNADPAKGVINTDELALLIGHELGHQLLQHNSKTMDAIARALSLSASSLSVFSDVNRTKIVDGKVQKAGDASLYRKAFIGGLASQTLIKNLLAPVFDRQKELEADRIGIDLARRAGYAVTLAEARSFVDHHSADAALLDGRLKALSFVLGGLTANLSAQAGRMAGGGDLGTLASAVTAGLGEKLQERLIKGIADRAAAHPDPAQRKAFVEAYFEKVYPNARRGPDGKLMPHNIEVLAVMQDPQVARLVGNVTLAQTVRTILEAAKPDPTGVSVDASVKSATEKAGFVAAPATPAPAAATVLGARGKKKKGRPAPAPAPPTPPPPRGFADDGAAATWELQGKLREANGNAPGARGDWQQGLRSRWASLELARSYAGTVPAEAGQGGLAYLVDRYGKALGTTDPILDLVVARKMAEGDVAGAEVAAGKCVSYEGGKLYLACSAALGYNPLDKETPAKTPEGKKAFAGKSLEKNLRGIFNFFDFL